MKTERDETTLENYFKTKIFFAFCLFFPSCWIFVSCEKVIDPKLNLSESKIVIEGNIFDQSGPYTVSITRTLNYKERNNFPPVSGAVVKIQDDFGNSEILTEASPGRYKTLTTQGIPGRTYTIDVIIDGKTYKAVSKMPPAVTIDTLRVEELVTPSKVEKYISATYSDPADPDNYYRFIEIINGIEQSNIFIDNDQLKSQQSITKALLSPPDNTEINSGDTVTVLLQAIDYNVYEYFRTLLQITNTDFVTALPTNPLTNFGNGALGYFNACAVRSKTIVIR